MDFQKALQKFKKEVDQEIEKQFDIVIANAEKNNASLTEALEHAKHIALVGGKRIRGALLYYGYQSAGGRDKKKIIMAAAAVELAHLFILIHDDVIDRGTLRRGVKTLHEKFSKKKYTGQSGKNARHFGESLAIIVGDLFYAILNKIILEAGFEQTATISGLTQIQKIGLLTAIGQTQDIAIGYADKITTKDVLTMYKNKTARYTFEGPLQIGMIFAGSEDKKILDQIKRYAIPIGIAFQIQDDILGIFGNEKVIGKSATSDISEGKNTFLVVKARELASPLQKKQLQTILGKKNASQNEHALFRSILLETGAVTYARQTARDYLTEGGKRIAKAILSKEARYFLTGLVDYLEKRKV